MSTKVAVIVGDYSNGWSDSWVVQMAVEGITIAKLGNDKNAVMQSMMNSLTSVVDFLSQNEKINPKPKDEPCCDGFEFWFKDNQKSKYCGLCGKVITTERAMKHTKELIV